MAPPDDAERPRPPSTARVVWLMTAMHLSRWLARGVAQLNRTKEKKVVEGAPVPRSATPGKASGRWPLLLLMLVMGLLCSLNIFHQLVLGLGAELELPRTRSTTGDSFDQLVERHAVRRGTRYANPMTLEPVWPTAPHQKAMVTAVGLLLVGLALTQFFISLGYTNKDLGKVEWHMEWLWSLPVSGRTLFFGQLPGMVASDAWVWLMTGPLLLVVYYSVGWGWLTIPLAVAATAYLSLLLCSLRLLTETVLRVNLGASGLKNVQALCTMLGLGFYFSLLYFAFYPAGLGTLADLGRAAPVGLIANPFSLPAALALRAPGAWVGILAGMVVLGVLLPFGLVGTAGWLVRGGLLGHSGTHQGKRGPGTRRESRLPLFTGVLGKEVLVLLRDRNLTVQVLVVPMLMFGLYFVAVPGVRSAALSQPTAAAALAFGFGAYALMVSAACSLAFEGSALWLLYTLPHRLTSILVRKAALWSGLALFYTLATLVAVVCLKPELAGDLVLPGGFALGGVPIMGVLAAGLGALSTDPFQSDLQRRLNPEKQFLYMFIAGIYGSGLATPGIWPKIVLMTLATLAAWAVWQHVTDRLPYLLDPTALPPRQITLVDGLVAALAFFGLQGVIQLLLVAAEVSPGPAVVAAFSVSGLLVVGFVLAAFHSGRMPAILASVGLRASGAAPPRWLRTAATGLVCGTAATVVLGLYLFALNEAVQQGWLSVDRLKEGMHRAGDMQVWLSVLAVVAAPLFEEFIFRGLVFRGLRRSMPFVAAAVVSAAVFALVHPPVSVAPVFVLGLAAAWAYERSGLLLAPILTHMVYNAAAILLGQWLLP